MKTMKTKFTAALITAAIILQQLSLVPLTVSAETGAIWGGSPIDELGYSYVQKGGFTGKEQPASPDPLVNYRWDDPKAADDVEIFLRKPLKVDSEAPESFNGMESLMEEDVEVNVTGEGTIRMDFGVELAGWLEIDSPDLEASGSEITLGVSEYNQPMFVNFGPQSPNKTRKSVKYGNTYRLELNSELYEGVRFGFINITDFTGDFTITDVRLVCQVKPANYNSTFSSDNEMLNKIWYTAAYDVRANLKKEYMAAVIIDRGDRHSWTGDAYPTQAASLTAFGNYDFVLKNIQYTEQRSNGIENYELYWVLSILDYYEYTGDVKGIEAEFVYDNGAARTTVLDAAKRRLDHAYDIYGDKSVGMGFFGSDERLGACFENANIEGNYESYKLLAIQAWSEFAVFLDEIGETAAAEKYRGYAQEKATEMLSDEAFYDKYDLHTASYLINSGVLSEDIVEELAEKHFTNRVTRQSYSAFNQYFIWQAMGKAGYYDDALESILDMLGGHIEYGATTYFENYREQWNDVIEKNGPIPNNQTGYTSLAHPWGAGVLTWLSEEILGIKATKAAFEEFAVKPHLGRQLTQVSGDMYTPNGTIEASFDTAAGIAHLVVPENTTAVMGIPKVEKTITSITMNGNPITITKQDEEFVYIENLGAGSYGFSIEYDGETPDHAAREYIYPAQFVGKDFATKGNWGGVYGSEGYILCNWGGKNIMMLPEYVEDVSFSKTYPVDWSSMDEDDERALADNPYNTGIRQLGAYRTNDNGACYQTMLMDINLVEDRDYTVALYFVDYDTPAATEHSDGSRRELAVEMLDGETLTTATPVQVLRDYQGGAYLIYRYNKSARFRINQMRGLNATLSGVFFGDGNSSGPVKSFEMIDDRDEQIYYNSTNWYNGGPFPNSYATTLKYSNVKDDYIEYQFSGDNITYYASKEGNRGIVEVFLDGQSQGEFDLYSPNARRMVNIFTAKDLEDGEHTIKLVVTGAKNEHASDCYVDIDAFAIRRDDLGDHNVQSYIVDDQARDTDGNYVINYVKGSTEWANVNDNKGRVDDTFSFNDEAGSYAEFKFRGSGIDYYASRESNRGYVEIEIDGEIQETVDLYADPPVFGGIVYSKDGLDPNQEHTFKAIVKGEKNAASSGTYIDVDAFKVKMKNIL